MGVCAAANGHYLYVHHEWIRANNERWVSTNLAVWISNNQGLTM